MPQTSGDAGIPTLATTPAASFQLILDELELTGFSDYLGLTYIDYLSIDDILELADIDRKPETLFVLMNLFAAMKAGSVCLRLEPEDFLKPFPLELRPKAQTYLNVFLKGLATNQYAGLISSNATDFVPLILAGRQVRLLYFQKYYQCESDLKKRLAAFLTGQDTTAFLKTETEQIIEELYSDQRTIRLMPKGAPIFRDPIQEQALKLGLTSPLTIISGGPGTGKTSLMVNLLRGFLCCGVDVGEILLGAPTGRAAQRITETLRAQITTISGPFAGDESIKQLKGATIHRILKYDPKQHQFHYNTKRRLPVKVIIVDEVSMVDLAMMDHLLKAVDPETTRIIFLGDKNQLPSVEAGAVLTDMILPAGESNPFEANLVVLKTVFRSGKALTQLAENINQGSVPILKAVDFDTSMERKDPGWDFVVAQNSEELPHLLYRWAMKKYLEQTDYLALVGKASKYTTSQLEQSETGSALLMELMAASEKARILTLTRVGPLGCAAINDIMARIIRHLTGNLAHRHSGFKGGLFSGALIIIRKNDYAKELFNGDIGVVIMDANGIMKVYFQKNRLFFGYSPDLLPPFEMAFALTVHQSQGSEYHDILLILPDDIQSRLLSREMLYTAVTRAQKRVCVYGRQEIFSKAASRRIHRQTGMSESV